jgi:hypothetical protein
MRRSGRPTGNEGWLRSMGDRRGTSASAPTHCAFTSLNLSDPGRTFVRVRILKQKVSKKTRRYMRNRGYEEMGREGRERKEDYRREEKDNLG